MSSNSVLLKTVPEHSVVWHRVFANEAPHLKLIDWEPGQLYKGTRFAALLRPPGDIIQQTPSLQLMFSVAAVLDHLPLASVPDDVIVVRMIAEDVTRSMVEYVIWATLLLHRDFHTYIKETPNAVWNPRLIRRTSERTVGILGLGVLGSASARSLAALGFQVRGWSTSEKNFDGIKCFHGDNALPDFLTCCEILICLLPLTERTRGILNASLFYLLPNGAMIINVGRGGHMVETDLLDALSTGKISGAVLDVLAEEPPDPNNPLLRHPQILVTPHTASASQPDEAARQMIAAIHNVQRGRIPVNTINRANGF